MAEYIDGELLIEKIARLRGCSCSYSDGIIDEVEDIMSDLPTADAIPLDKVKQAREEIDDLDRYFDNDYFSSNRDAMFKCNEVLEILDKLIESEE